MRDGYDPLEMDEGPSTSRSRNHGPWAPLETLSSKVLALCGEIVTRSRFVRIILGCLGFACVLFLLHESGPKASSQRFGLAHALWVIGVAGYAYLTEMKRLPGRTKEIKELRQKCRKLVQARRAAGLLRLEKDIQMRRDHWPAPPKSGLKAYLYKESSLDSMAVESPMKRRQVDYKNLCTKIAHEVLISARDGGGTSASNAGESFKSLFRLLSQAGPEPVKDPELYRDMHLALDEVEKQLKQSQAKGFYCRLCLGYQNGTGKSCCVILKCKHNICKECAQSLVESSLSGTIGVPISCPVGCNSIMSPQLLKPMLCEDLFERFQRIHTVKMSLQASAPHVRSLANDLAEARKGLALRRNPNKDKGGPSGQQDHGSKRPKFGDLKIRTNALSQSSTSSATRFADTSGGLNHRRLK